MAETVLDIFRGDVIGQMLSDARATNHFEAEDICFSLTAIPI